MPVSQHGKLDDDQRRLQAASAGAGKKRDAGAHAPMGQQPRPVSTKTSDPGAARDDKEALIRWLSIELGDPELRRALTKTSHVVKARNVILARARNKHIQEAAEALKHEATADNIVQRSCAMCVNKAEASKILAHWNKLRQWSKGSKKTLKRRAKGNKNEDRTLGFRGKHKKHQSRHQTFD